jgi:chitodextrinase/predicted chitinase
MSKKRLLAYAAAAGIAVAGSAAAIVPMTSSSAAAACSAGYSASAVYTANMNVSHNGRNWTAKWWTQGEAPSTGGSGVWADKGACGGGGGNPGGGNPGGGNPGGGNPGAGSGNFKGDWRRDVTYMRGDVIRYTNGSCHVSEHDNNLSLDPLISTWWWEPTSCPGGGNPGGGNPGGGNPGGGNPSGVFPVSKQQFESLYPNRNPFYTYEGIVRALEEKFPQVTRTGDDATRKREAAAILANWAQETGEFVYVEEIAKADYCQAGPPGCAPGKRYYGRGPTQLSWNYNYKTAGDALGLNLWADPDIIARDPKVAMMTGFWYWTTGRGAGGPTPHEAMTRGDGFGATIRAINGIECNGGYPAKMQNRVDRYKRYTAMLGVDPGGNLTC